ncbi:MAG: hypothetical protein RL338_620 [Chloroflexota bacterium]|jgi:uncharacterized membrane protein YbaN (DUF454 family)
MPHPVRVTPPNGVRPATSPLLRAVLIVVGTTSLAIGIVGIFVPLLPTTVFVLIAAACYARASDRLYGWLLEHRRLGPVVRDWREHRSMTRTSKRRAYAGLFLGVGISALLVDELALRLLLLGLAAIAVVVISRVRTRD